MNIFTLPVKKLAESYPIIKSSEFSTKKAFNEFVCQSPVWMLSISLDVLLELNRKINHID